MDRVAALLEQINSRLVVLETVRDGGWRLIVWLQPKSKRSKVATGDEQSKTSTSNVGGSGGGNSGGASGSGSSTVKPLTPRKSPSKKT